MSKIFEPHRVIGMVANNKPCVLQMRGTEHFVTTCVGKSFNTYSCKKLCLLFVSPLHDDEISCLIGHKDTIFTGAENKLYAWIRGKLVRSYLGHERIINHILPFGEHVISIGEDKRLLIHDIETGTVYSESWLPHHTTAVTHPATYLNKILIGSKEGVLELWNIRTVKLVHRFNPFDSEITVLTQSPAVDIIGIGLLNGQIRLHNIKLGETLLSFHQDWGCVTSLSFRTDGTPHMVSSSSDGHIAVWDLDKRELHSTLHHAHHATIASTCYLASQPLLLTTSADNSIKIWVFDEAGGTARLLKERSGHRAPPTTARFYGDAEESVLSAGYDRSVRMFSVIKDERSKELSQGSIESKSKKLGVRVDELMLGPVTALAAEEIREREWSNVITAHAGSRDVRMWNTVQGKLDNKPLSPKPETIVVTAVAITVCGNIGMVGYDSGHLTAFNLQSGINRGLYGNKTAHKRKITGIATDNINKYVLSCGADRTLKVWDLDTRKKVSELLLTSPITRCVLHRDSNLLAVSLASNRAEIVDIDTVKIVRSFSHAAGITDMCYSRDGRWLVVSTLDHVVRIWDLVTARLIDCFKTEDLITSVSLSREYLVTTQLNNLGIYIWNNKTLYQHVELKPLPDNCEPRQVGLFEQDDVMAVEEEEDTSDNWQSSSQITEALITLSSVPKARWSVLCNLDVIKKRNKPKEAPKTPKSAPFFLGTTRGLVPKFVVENTDEKPEEPMSKTLCEESEFQRVLARKDTAALLRFMEAMTPSALDVELQSLAPEDGGSHLHVQNFLEFVMSAVQQRTCYDLVQAYLNVFLKYNRRYLIETPALQPKLTELQALHSDVWRDLQHKVQECLCVTQFIKSATL